MTIKNIIKIIIIIILTSLFCTVIQQDSSCVIFPKQLVLLATFFNDALYSYYTKMKDFMESMYSIQINSKLLSLDNEVLKQRIFALETRSLNLEEEIFNIKKREVLARIELNGLKPTDSSFSFNTLVSTASIFYNIYSLYHLSHNGGFNSEDRFTLKTIHSLLNSISPSKSLLDLFMESRTKP